MPLFRENGSSIVGGEISESTVAKDLMNRPLACTSPESRPLRRHRLGSELDQASAAKRVSDFLVGSFGQWQQRGTHGGMVEDATCNQTMF